MDGTTIISGKYSGLQRRFKHKVPQAKYVRWHSHKLALVFIHLLPQFKVLQDVDIVVLSCWKMMKY